MAINLGTLDTGYRAPTSSSNNPALVSDWERMFRNATLAGGIGGLGAGIAGLFNNRNPMESALPWMNQIPGTLNQGYGAYQNLGMQALNPLMGQYQNNLNWGNTLNDTYGQLTGNNYSTLQNQYGQMAQNLPALQNQYSQLMNDPNAIITRLGEGFQASPGYKYQVNQATNASNAAAAAGGMLGSPAQQKALAETIGGMANQDYNNYLNRAQGLFGSGLSGLSGLQSQGLAGLQGLFNTGLAGQQGMYGGSLAGLEGLGQLGYGANTGLANSIVNYLQNQAQGAYAGQAEKQAAKAQGWGNIFGGLGNLASLY